MLAEEECHHHAEVHRRIANDPDYHPTTVEVEPAKPGVNPTEDYLYYTEPGTTPEPIIAYVQSSDFDIGDGHNFGYVWRILPDVNFNGSNTNQPSVTMTLKPRYNSGSAYETADYPTVTSSNNFINAPQYTIQEFTGQVYTRLRGRQMAFRISSDGLGVAWQLGTPRLDIKNDGRR